MVAPTQNTPGRAQLQLAQTLMDTTWPVDETLFTWPWAMSSCTRLNHIGYIVLTIVIINLICKQLAIYS